ncbi:MAG: hypothetical protein ACI30A_02020 [Paludibacteraceae bacterium]
MPYRRLPNTDQARLTALQSAVQCASEADFTEQVLQYKTLMEAQRFLMQFENSVMQYRENFRTKVSANKQYRHVVQNARMYISHFIQVLNLAVIRGEIKKELKELYGLDPSSHIVPDLSGEEDILIWGENIIQGEQKRTSMGGFPIYNPAINKVKVHYDIFKEHQVGHTIRKKNTNRVMENMEDMRKQADAIILEIWNQVEDYYKDLLPYDRLCHCQNYGLIYYYRPKEKRLSPKTDKEISQRQASQTTIQWSSGE